LPSRRSGNRSLILRDSTAPRGSDCCYRRQRIFALSLLTKMQIISIDDRLPIILSMFDIDISIVESPARLATMSTR